MKPFLFSSCDVLEFAPMLNRLKNKTILITGACGLVASSLIDFFMVSNYFLNTNIEIIALARSSDKFFLMYPHYKTGNFKFIESDVRDVSTEKIGKCIDYIINAASPAHPLAYSKHPVEVILTNVIGTLKLLEIAKDNNARLLYVSSSEVYGENKNNDFANSEDDYGYINLLSQRSCYPEGKRAAESLCISYNNQYGTDSLIARLCATFGPLSDNENTRADLSFLRNAVNGEDIVMKSPGTQIRSMCYIKDVVSALIYILLDGERSKAYNVSSCESVASIREFAEILSTVANVRVINDFPTEKETIGFSQISRAVTDSAKLLGLGWHPKYTLKDGIVETYNFMCNADKRL